MKNSCERDVVNTDLEYTDIISDNGRTMYLFDMKQHKNLETQISLNEKLVFVKTQEIPTCSHLLI